MNKNLWYSTLNDTYRFKVWSCGKGKEKCPKIEYILLYTPVPRLIMVTLVSDETPLISRHYFIHLYKFDSWDIITLSFQQHLGFIWSFPLLGNWKNKTKENFIVKLRPSTTRRQRELGKKPAGSDEPSEDAIFTFLFGYYGFQFGVDEGKASESCLVHRINEVFISMGETRLLIQELTIKVAVVTGGFLLVGG